MSGIDYGIIIVYMLGMIAVGMIAQSRIKTMDDFILGGKRFNTFALIGTIMATMVGSGMTMGAVGNVYKNGLGGSIFWIYIGFAVGLIVFGFMGQKIRQTGARSVAEVISIAFGKKARLASAIIVIAYAIGLVAINIAGLRTVIIYIFGQNIAISIPLATTIAALISIVYTALGGFFAVVWTDVVQLVIMIIGVFIIGPILGLNLSGGFDVISSEYAAQGMSITNPLVNGLSSWMIGIALAYFLAVPGDPTMPQRAFSGKNDSVVKKAFVTSSMFAIYFGAALIIIGGSIFVLMPELENADSALIMFILNYYPPVLKGITIAGIMAAIMSSFDSFLILATTHIMYDIGRIIKPDLAEDAIKKSLPILTVVLGILGVLVALFIQSLLGYLYMVFSIAGSALVPAMISAMYFKEKCSRTAVVLGIIAGGLVPAVLYLTKGYDVFLGDPVFIGLFSSIAIIFFGSLILKDKSSTTSLENENEVG